MKKSLKAAGLAAAAWTACIASSQAADGTDWPRHAVRLIVPYAPGGIADQMARITAEALQAAFNQPFIVENKPAPAAAWRRPTWPRASPTAIRCW